MARPIAPYYLPDRAIVLFDKFLPVIPLLKARIVYSGVRVPPKRIVLVSNEVSRSHELAVQVNNFAAKWAFDAIVNECHVSPAFSCPTYWTGFRQHTYRT
jgi:hypothetical protein